MKIMVGCHPKGRNNALLELAVQHANIFNGKILLVSSIQGEEKLESLNEFIQTEAQLEK